jgi:plastocyanin
MKTNGPTPLLLAAILALLVSGCGGGGESAPAADAGPLELTGRDDLTWDTTMLQAPAGMIQIALTCGEAVNHNVVIEETDEQVVACAPGETATGTVVLDAGAYTYLCTVPGHSGTMRGTLTVS